MGATLSRLSLPMAILAGAIVVGLAFDGAVLINHLQPTAQHSSGSKKSDQSDKANKPDQANKANKQHPCNHGFYVSQAAHAQKTNGKKGGGDYVKQIATSDLGKDGNCSKPLPSPTATTNPTSDSEED